MRSKLVPILLNRVPGWVRSNYGLLVPSVVTHYDEGRAWVQGFGTVDPTSLITTVRASTGYAATSAGGLNLFQANIPRITDLGLLVEQAATNIVIQSGFASGWTTQNSTVTTGQSAPDGTTTAIKLTDSVGAAQHRQFQGSITVTNVPWTYSVYAKAGVSVPFIQILFNDGATSFWGNFNLSTGVVASKFASVTTQTITALANGWYRCSITATPAAGTGNIQVLMTDTDQPSAAPAYTGTGAGTVFLWGAQLEASAFPTSYIPTTTVSVTRAADSIKATVNIPAPYTAFISMGGLPSISGLDLVAWGSLANGAGISATGGTSDAFVRESSVTTADPSAGTITANAAFKVAARYAVNSVNISATGGIGTNDTSVTPLTMTTIGFGAAQVAFRGGVPNGYVKRFAIFSTGLADAQLQGLTQ